MGARLTIGDFSRVTHLTVKTLRHYHQVGLLEPDTIDPHNGYRYYSAEQVPTAQVVRRLRELEMPIPEVKAVLASSEASERNARIAAHLDALEAELARTRQSVHALRDLLERPSAAARIEYRTLPATPAVGIRQVVDREDILAWWQGALGELTATVRAQKLQRTGPSGGLYANEIFLHGCGEATVFIPVDGAADGAVRAIGRVVPFVVPAAELAVVRHHGSLDDIDVTYGELGTHAMNHEISVDGPLREYYLCGHQDTDDEDKWETEVCWPVFRADSDSSAAAAQD